MKIGFDARWYFNGPVSGKLVVRNLLDRMISNNLHTIVPIFNIKDKNNVYKKFGNINCIFTKIRNPLISNVFEIPFLKKSNELDIIIFQNFSPFFGSFKKINYIHDIIFEDRPEFFTKKEKLYFSPMKYLSMKADLVITISKNEKDRIIRKGYSKNVAYVYHGIDTSMKNMAKNVKNLPKEYILAVGRINIRKNISTLIRSISLIKNKNIKLVIVGEDSWKKEKINIDAKLKSRIVFLKNISNEELGYIYSNARVFCFVSLDEGFGLPIVEAMSFGIPVICSNISVMPEVSGNAGILVDPYSENQIADKIDLLLSDKLFYEQQQKLSIKKASEYSWEKSTEKIIKLCEQL